MKLTNAKLARRRITECCLVAADVDRTILAQALGERSLFLHRVAPQLLDAAKLGMKLAFVTGNSMSQLADRFLQWLIDHLCYTDNLALLPHFHFFCNSGGVYFHFSDKKAAISALLKQHPSDQAGLAKDVLRLITVKNKTGETCINPAFVDTHYLTRTQIPFSDVDEIRQILEDSAATYLSKVAKSKKQLAVRYDMSDVTTKGVLRKPSVDVRPVQYLSRSGVRDATVQLTLKPVLSFRHGRSKDLQKKLFEHDLRTDAIRDIQRRLDSAGLAHYTARPGGRSSIDVTLEKLDKAYAMEFLIDHLNLQGHARNGQRFGSNAVYFGDEVIVGGGNDYPVTRIQGLLVFAVNPEKALIPFLTQVFVPSSILEGPEATADVLGELNKLARTSLAERAAGGRCSTCTCDSGSAIDCFKVKVFGERIHLKTEALKIGGRLKPDEWQILHAFVTLMHRDDPWARQWLRILIEELDSIMMQLSDTKTRTTIRAGGTSHPDN